MLYLLLAVIAYYLYFKKSPLTFLNTISLVIITWWHYPSAIAVLGFSVFTYLLQQKNNRYLSGLGIVFQVFALFYFKTNLLWSDVSQNNYAFLGLSYFVLQNISLLLSENQSNLSFSQLLFGNVFFAKFVSGPILLKDDFKKLMPANELEMNNIAQGVQRILFGLAKKLILADRLAIMVNNVYSPENAFFNGFSLLFATVLFTFQMYLDFSAYTDIALGTAKLFGINLKENFNLPMRSISVTEYWRRTHISLINWLTQYIYYPIVYHFRKHPYSSVILAISTTFILSGIWHGLSMGYVLWGALNGLYLMLEFTGRKKWNIQNKSLWLGIPLTLFFVSFSNFFFKAKSVENIQLLWTNFVEFPFFPKDWMVEFVAVIGNGGHFLQQYNLLESASLFVLFFVFEKRLEILSRKSELSFWYLLITALLILFFGNFNAGDEFIYVQF